MAQLLFALRLLPRDEDAPAEGSEYALVCRARANDARAFRILFERYSPRVWRFLRDLFQDDAAADEATQETFVRAHARLGALREEQRVVSWMLGIARHVFLETRRARRDVVPVDADEPDEQLQAQLATATPEDLLLDRETEVLMGEALGLLREDRRAALLLRIDHGLPYEEIAQVMGWSLAKVKNEIHRARLQLRERLIGHVRGTP